ncbi:MAG: hypothetical protein J0L97_03335 [Alphaproteobacteria bacterium]|nr:hypothetical protein [Alphaproteobacteria bacterium]
MKELFKIATAFLGTCALAACADDASIHRAPGKYESTTTSTDQYGTTVKREETTDVQVDSSGRKKAVVKSKTTRDPKGLLNKTTTETEKRVEER